MKDNALIYGVIGFVLGAICMSFISTNNPRQVELQKTSADMHMMGDGEMMNDDMMGGDSMSMDGMVEALKGKTGDAFDEEFIKQMILHHQGAIDMAQLAAQYAEHEELKQLGTEIIEAQTREIEMMKQWQTNWGYIK